MSIKKIKSKRLLSKHKLQTKTKRKQNLQMHARHNLEPQNPVQNPHKHQSILDIIQKLSVHRNNLRKSQNNLPAHLMKLKSTSSSSLQHAQYAQHAQQAKVFSNSVSKSMSSSFSSVTKNGETHKKGKTIINNSTRPFIEIKEMDNNNIKHYMVPKNTIPYKSNLIMVKKSKKQKQKKSTKQKKSPKQKKSRKQKKSTK